MKNKVYCIDTSKLCGILENRWYTVVDEKGELLWIEELNGWYCNERFVDDYEEHSGIINKSQFLDALSIDCNSSMSTAGKLNLLQDLLRPGPTECPTCGKDY